jgi:hypothetical protein
MRQQKRRARTFNGNEGIDFVRCRICGDYRRVISARHLSKHGIEREAYMEEYHLSPDELIAKAFRRIQSSRTGYYPYGKSDWIAAIKKVYRTDGDISAKYLQDNYHHIYVQGVWIYGDWDKALGAAGFNPERMRLRRFWNQDKIIAGIRQIRRQELPLNAHYVMKNHPSLFSGALRQYGSWNAALVASLSKKELQGNSYQSRLQLLRTLRDCLERNPKRKISQAVKLQAAYYFGGLEKAIVALKRDQRFLSGWSKTKIIKILSQMHRSKENLAYANIRHKFPALLSAAEAYFGSWGKALYAAGIDPNEYFVRRDWHQRKK